ncbi:ApaLI family restriction endonuclease [Lentibacillus sp. CBA3610]|uniref:ApaLI family restriction endonuclease n=1 Tax=Lentibacillus sp. CBA3610 TaxID=2518176 RepID=UPI001C3ED3C4|nr:ApaLI family restriction endonuclease [Lentibacillus sp. CBA3610]
MKQSIYTQNKGRFLYKCGSFLEEATILCFEHKYGERAEKKVRIPNTIGQRPKKFEIDCLVGQDAYEIKWRDATQMETYTKGTYKIQVNQR